MALLSVTLCSTACDVYMPLTNGAMSTARQLSNRSRSSSLWNIGILLLDDSAGARPAVCTGRLEDNCDDNRRSEISLESLASIS